MAHGSDNGETCQLFHILAVGDGNFEIVFQEEEQGWNQKTNDDGYKIVHHRTRRDNARSLQTSLIKNLVVRGIGSFKDLGLSATTHQIFKGLVREIEITLNVDKLLLFTGQLARLHLQRTNATLYLIKAHLGVVHKIIDILKQCLFCRDNLFIEFHNLRVLLGLGEQLGSLGLRQRNEVTGQLVKQRVVDTHCTGSGKILRVVDLHPDIILQTLVYLQINRCFSSFSLQSL